MKRLTSPMALLPFLPLLALLASLPASAVDYGEVSPNDPRVRFYTYHPEEVYALTGFYGYVTPVFFRSDEKIEVLSIGDSEAWQATPSEARDMVLLKPVRANASTNLVVITDRRTYAFDLSSDEADAGSSPSYKVRFRYGEPREATEDELEDAAARAARAQAEANARAREAEQDRLRREALRDERRASPSIILDETGKGGEDRLTPAIRGPRDLRSGDGIRTDNGTGSTRALHGPGASLPGAGAADFRQGGNRNGAQLLAASFSAGGAGVYTDDRRFLDADPDAGLVDTIRAERITGLSTRILEGALISGVLETAINSDLTGMIRAQVAEPVWSADGSRVLVPPGSRLVGTYRSAVNFGQTRVLILWNRVITPTGISVLLNSPGTDALGRAGLGGDADTKFAERFGAAALISIISGGTELLTGRLEDDYRADAAKGIGRAAGGATSQILEPYASLRPTIHVDQGAKINVFVRRDLDFKGAI